MRHGRLLLPILLALTAAACARQQPSYYVTDSATGRRVATGQQATPNEGRGLFTSGDIDLFSSGPRASEASARQDTGRGLFGGGHADTQAYAYQAPAPQQAYAYRPPQNAAAQPPRQTAVMQYQPPQPAPQAYAQNYQPQTYVSQGYGSQAYAYPPQPQPTGYYAARYRWY